MPACARREYPSNDRRLASILAVDVVGLLTPDGRGRRGRCASIAKAARPITFNANNCFAPTPTSTPVVSQRPVLFGRNAQTAVIPRPRANGSSRPFGTLQDRSYEWAESRRKRSSAGCAGCAKGDYLTTGTHSQGRQDPEVMATRAMRGSALFRRPPPARQPLRLGDLSGGRHRSLVGPPISRK
jgi:hypothetical protein